MWIKRSKLEKLEEEKLQLKKELSIERANSKEAFKNQETLRTLVKGYELILLKVKEVYGVDNVKVTLQEVHDGVNFNYNESFNHADNTFDIKWGGIHDVKKKG